MSSFICDVWTAAVCSWWTLQEATAGGRNLGAGWCRIWIKLPWPSLGFLLCKINISRLSKPVSVGASHLLLQAPYWTNGGSAFMQSEVACRSSSGYEHMGHSDLGWDEGVTGQKSNGGKKLQLIPSRCFALHKHFSKWLTSCFRITWGYHIFC